MGYAISAQVSHLCRSVVCPPTRIVKWTVALPPQNSHVICTRDCRSLYRRLRRIARAKATPSTGSAFVKGIIPNEPK
jgi:hypothetical protein